MFCRAILSLIFLIFVGSCSTTGSKAFPARVVSDQGTVHVLEFKTGVFNPSIYDDYFIQSANEVCEGKGYDVLEKARVPKPLMCAEKALDPEKFYWVIDCKH